MAALIRCFNKLSIAETPLTASRLIRSLARSQEPDDSSINEHDPIDMKNPYEKEQQICILCKLNIEPDYKNVRLLSQFQSAYTGRIYGRNITGLCRGKQKKVEDEILKAQNAGMMGYYQKDPKYTKDPKLFDPNNPFRPHKY